MRPGTWRAWQATMAVGTGGRGAAAPRPPVPTASDDSSVADLGAAFNTEAGTGCNRGPALRAKVHFSHAKESERRRA